MIADAWVAIDGVPEFYGHRLERHLASLRAAFTHLALSSGVSIEDARWSDPGRSAILPILEREREFRNGPSPLWSFAGIDGCPVPAELIHTVKVPESAVRLVLASDGYPWIGESLEASERNLEEMLMRDPLVLELPATKGWRPNAESFDDRTYVAIDLRD